MIQHYCLYGSKKHRYEIIGERDDPMDKSDKSLKSVYGSSIP